MSNKEENIKLMRTSLDYIIYKNEIKIYGIIGISIALILILISLVIKSWLFMLALIPFMVMYIPMTIMKLIRMAKITKNCEDILLCESVLTNPRPSFNSTNYFSVVIKDSSGKTFKAQTDSIGTSRGLIKPHYTELNNKKVLIAYNNITKQVIVVKLL